MIQVSLSICPISFIQVRPTFPGVSRDLLATVDDHRTSISIEVRQSDQDHPLNRQYRYTYSALLGREQQHIMTESPDIKMLSDKGPGGAGEEGSKDTDCELEPCSYTSSLDKLS